MLTVTSSPLELRGVANKQTKKGKTYYVVNCESSDGTPHQLYCPHVEALPSGLKKGDMVLVTFDVVRFDNNERLVVNKVEKYVA